MLLRVTPTRLRDELTELKARVSAGDLLVAAGAHQPAVLIRPVRRGDRGRHTGLTVFRRRLHRVLREAAREPIIVTVVGDRMLWVGPTTEPVDDARERRRRRDARGS